MNNQWQFNCNFKHEIENKFINNSSKGVYSIMQLCKTFLRNSEIKFKDVEKQNIVHKTVQIYLVI